ncbi:unnamed protein product [Diatraea saccharalis]|uniref:Uncharacterized protein n=1 Tax=Diatraea saccharalis TaxID=40085 RepID=A0A9N9WBE4_9NEOP|nr:unnamed protein product [Diatraea saccharalis]
MGHDTRHGPTPDWWVLTTTDATVPELLDWSNDNILVAALGRTYHKWSWRTQSLISDGFARQVIQSCKFDPRGELLLLGTHMSTVEIHNNLLSKYVNSNFCRCLQSEGKICSITALDWSPTGNSFITMFSRGDCYLRPRLTAHQLAAYLQDGDTSCTGVTRRPIRGGLRLQLCNHHGAVLADIGTEIQP